ncbi:hypothetical protein ACIBTP_38080 [Streptomyces avidinii]|uniref:hypothetical protein n=1 Tax=Streptomyces avidinii TaxID=1895 RepID=UPI0037A278D6
MSTRRRLLEAIRRAHQADAAYTAADRARARAAKAAAAAHTRITHGPQLQDDADELAAAQAAHAGLVRREQEARAKVRRTFTAARAANRTLAALYTPHAEAARIEAEEGPLVWARGDALRRHVGEEAAADYLRRLALALAA